MNKPLISALTAAAALTLTGCASSLGVGSSEYGCAGMPAGVVCKTPAQVYAMTHSDRPAMDADLTAAKGSNHKLPPATATESNWLMPPAGGPVPVLEPAQVLRIWIGPWKDASNDLIWPSYTFTEVTPRKWAFGGQDFKDSRPLSPIMISPPAEPAATKPDPKN